MTTERNDRNGTVNQHTHYCEDCGLELSILYDEREDESVALVCGECGGTNTRRLERVEA